MYLVISVVSFLLVVVALVDIVTRPEWQVQHLPKIVWVLLVVFLPLIGSIVWFAVGREYRAPVEHVRYGDPRRHTDVRPSALAYGPGGVTTTEQEMAELDREIEFYEKQAQLKRLRDEVGGVGGAGRAGEADGTGEVGGAGAGATGAGV